MINKLTLIGRAGKDARVGVTSKGTHYASVSLATGTGDRTTWFDVVAYDKQAEWLAKAAKGANVYVEGPVSLSSFQSKDGTTKTNLQVTAYTVRVLSNQDDAGGAGVALSDDSDVPF